MHERLENNLSKGAGIPVNEEDKPEEKSEKEEDEKEPEDKDPEEKESDEEAII